jgi:glycosyltransferase involved in cell wall biosynthesis
MAAGLPVIATQINAIPEMVTHKETGFLIQPGDRGELARRIQYLMENPTLSREMGAKGRKVVEQKFNTQTHCQKIESIFREISTFK